MKKQPSKIEDVITTIIAFVLSFVIVAAIFAAKSIAWPILRFCGRAMVRGIRRLLTKTKVTKSAKNPKQLPTPDCFKGAPNLAPAKQVRF